MPFKGSCLSLLALSLCVALPALAGDKEESSTRRTRVVRVPGWGVINFDVDGAEVVVSNAPGQAAISLGRSSNGNSVAISRNGSAIAIGGGNQYFATTPQGQPFAVPIAPFHGAFQPDFQAMQGEWQAWADDLVDSIYRSYGIAPRYPRPAPNTTEQDEDRDDADRDVRSRRNRD